MNFDGIIGQREVVESLKDCCPRIGLDTRTYSRACRDGEKTISLYLRRLLLCKIPEQPPFGGNAKRACCLKTVQIPIFTG